MYDNNKLPCEQSTLDAWYKTTLYEKQQQPNERACHYRVRAVIEHVANRHQEPLASKREGARADNRQRPLPVCQSKALFLKATTGSLAWSF